MARNVCALPGCPHLVEDMVPYRHYCHEHDALNDNVEELFRDEVEGLLDTLVEGAQEEGRIWANNPKRRFEQYTTNQILLHANEILAEIEAGHTWAAIRHAIWVGMMHGLYQGVDERIKVERLEPDADWARSLRLRLRSSSPKHSDDEIQRKVEAMHKKSPWLSWSHVCETVGKQLRPSLSRRTIEKRAKPVDWRQEKKSGNRR